MGIGRSATPASRKSRKTAASVPRAKTVAFDSADPVRNDRGEPTGVPTIARDVTARNRAEAEPPAYRLRLEKLVEARTAELTAANRKLEAAYKELEAFSYSVSHDLRAPLRAIDGFSRILLEDYRDKFDAEGRRVLGIVRDNALRMERLIDDILAFSRAGRLEMMAAKVNMEALAREAVQDLAQAAAGRTLKIKIKPLPATHGDAAMLKRVWINLVENAIKFTAPKADAEIEIGARPGPRETVYHVADNGVGFDMKNAGRLFGVFQRLHGEREFPGTGIGLAIVKRVVTRHGGRVWAEGRVNAGATFYFALPAVQERHDA